MRRITFSTALALALVPLVPIWAQKSTKCPPVKPRSRQEVLMMANASNKKGCWVRQKNEDGTDGPLVFVSRGAPDIGYKQIPPPPAPITQLPERPKLGAARLDLNHLIVGSWTGTWMRFNDAATLQIAGADGSQLSGTVVWKEYIQNVGVADRNDPDIEYRSTVRGRMIDPVFDGKTVYFKVKFTESVEEIRLVLTGQKLIYPGWNRFGAEPTVFVRTR